MGSPKASNLLIIGGSAAFGVHTNCTSSLQPSTCQKWKTFKNIFDILTIHNDEMSYIKHVLDPLCVFFTLFGCLGELLPRGLGHNLLMQFSSLVNSKMEISETVFF